MNLRHVMATMRRVTMNAGVYRKCYQELAQGILATEELPDFWKEGLEAIAGDSTLAYIRWAEKYEFAYFFYGADEMNQNWFYAFKVMCQEPVSYYEERFGKEHFVS